MSRGFDEILRRSALVAARLEREAGLVPGGRLVLALENSAEHLALVAAAWRLGLRLVAVAPTTSATTFAGILAQAEPHAVAVDAANVRLARVKDAWAAECLRLDGIEVAWQRRATPPAASRRPDATGEDWREWLAQLPPAVFYTSGSTSTAKGVPLEWPRILEKGKAVLGFYGVTREDRIMPLLPFSHVYGLYWLLGTAALGAQFGVLRESDGAAALTDALAESAATVAVCPPIVGAFLFGRRSCPPAVRDRLRVLTMGGAATSCEQAKRILAALPTTRVFLSYGLAETYSTICANEISRPGANLASVGPFRFGAFGEVREGELCVGGTLMAGYVGAAHGGCFTEDGLFRTGDLATIDTSGAVAITGRVKDMINAGGLSIFPSEIEEVLKQHPAVADCGVFGERVGELEVPCAAVALREAKGEAARDRILDELLAHCRAHLSAKMMPRRIVTVAAVPRGALGKIARAELRAMCSEPAGSLA